MNSKRIFAVLTAIAVLLAVLVSCAETGDVSGTPSPGSSPGSADSQENAEFREFTETFLVSEYMMATYGIHDDFKIPENFGFPADYAVAWCVGEAYSDEVYEAFMADSAARLAEFGYDSLNADQKIVYSLLEYNFRNFSESLDTEYYDEYLIPGTGMHMMIPIILSEYKLQRERDITDRIYLIETVGELLSEIAEYESERSARGFFMTDDALDTVLEECAAFIADPGGNMLITSFDEEMSALGFDLDDALRAEYTERNRLAVLDKLIPAYEEFMTAIEAFRGTGVNTAGLVGLPLGREYIALRLKIMGLSYTPEEYIQKIDDALAADINELIRIITGDYDAVSRIETLGFPGKPAEEIIEFLKSAAVSDFPALSPGTEFKVNYVDKSQEEAARPAMYLPPQVDYPEGNVIKVNNLYAESDASGFFTTLAHEGYPGHLQQFAGLRASDASLVRKLQNYQANTEGWATYAELYSAKYLGDDKNAIDLIRLDSELNLLMSGRVEMGVNYEGWTLDDVEDFLAEYGFSAYADVFYDLMVSSPLIYVMYVGGWLEFVDLRAAHPEMSDLEFHTACLDAGIVPFSILADRLGGT
ncbi:MAG: DUF885 domain-containing protein [Oscillospiraceae bacterium]|jgi:uncharacterized protein (DUF885 family)|nr:DUF885 domain-containing protein [Oscillospiraceae bacterium]